MATSAVYAFVVGPFPLTTSHVLKLLAQSSLTALRLPVRGIILGYVTTIAEYWNKGNNVEPWCRIAMSIMDWSRYSESREEVLWRTLITNRSGQRCPAPKDLQNSFRDFLIAMLAEELHLASADGPDFESFWNERRAYKSFCRSGSLDVAQDKVYDVEYYLSQPTDVRISALRFYQHAIACQSILHSAEIFEKSWEIPGGRLFTTSSGHLGLAPKSTMERDLVCVLQGARIPFIVRPADDHGYKLVGEAYVHRIMHGEVADLGLPLEELFLE